MLSIMLQMETLTFEAKADTAINQEQANADTRDTYFGSSFWSGGMQRLLTISSDGSKRAKQLSD